MQRGEGDEGKREGIPGGGNSQRENPMGKAIQSEQGGNRPGHGGPCEDFGFYAEENGEPLEGTEQRHDMI